MKKTTASTIISTLSVSFALAGCDIEQESNQAEFVELPTIVIENEENSDYEDGARDQVEDQEFEDAQLQNPRPKNEDSAKSLLGELDGDEDNDEDSDEKIDQAEQQVDSDEVGFRAGYVRSYRSYWTRWASEEDPPIDCAHGTFAKAFDCRGPYCNDVQLLCRSGKAYRNKGSYWTSWFSEERRGRRVCGSHSWLTGVNCSGWWCDNLSIRCTTTEKRATNCRWSGRYSEEDHWFTAPDGYFIHGIACYGAYCDEKKYQYCRMGE